MPIRPFARWLLALYVAVCSTRRLREERACLYLKRRILVHRGGTVATVALIDAFLELSWRQLRRRRLV